MSYGKGVVDFTNYMSGNRPQLLSLIMKKYGNLPIIQIDVYRKPVNTMLQKIFDWSNSGQWETEKKRLNYDDIYHLSMIATLSNGMQVLLEKSAKVNIKIMGTKYSMSGEKLTIYKDKIVSNFSGMIDNFEASMKSQKLSPYVYDAVKNNCQIFILNMIKAAGVRDATVENFIKQDTDELLGSKLAAVAKPTTDIAGALGNLIGGAKKRVKSEPHAILFNISKWTASEARNWLKKHNFQPMKRVHKMDNNLRYSLTPANYKSYSSKSIGDDIVIVLGWGH